MQFKNKEIYEEPFDKGNQYRKDYVDSIARLIANRKDKAAEERERYLSPEKLAANPEQYRNEYHTLLGYPLTEYTPSVPNVVTEFTAKDDMCDIYRLQIEVLPDFFFYSMLFLPHNRKTPSPLVITQHGGGGTPELCCDMHGKNNYNHMTRRVIERGAIVFSPQLLLWNNGEGLDTAPAYGVPYNRGEADALLKTLGGGITALEIYCIMRSIDYLSTLPEVDADKIGMHGLSYGGYFTLYTMAADTRIKAGYSCACFNNRFTRFHMDMMWNNSANHFMDAEVAALCAPRSLYLEVGKEDGVFDYRTAVTEFSRVPKYFEAFDAADHVKFHVWDGGHKVDLADDGYDFFFSALEQ